MWQVRKRNENFAHWEGVDLGSGNARQKSFRGRFWIFCGVDRTADDKVIGAGAKRVFGRRHAALVAAVGTGKAYARRNDEKLRSRDGANRARFLTRSNEAVESCVVRQFCAVEHQLFGRQ